MSDTDRLDKDLVTASRRSTRTNPVGDFYALDASNKSTLASAVATTSGLSQSAPAKSTINPPASVQTPPGTPHQTQSTSTVSVSQAVPPPAVILDMASKGSVSLNKFSGSPDEDPVVWLSLLEDYILFKSIPDAKQLSFFKLQLSSSALNWLVSLPLAERTDYATLRASFLARFQPRELEKFRFASALFNDKQKHNESVDDFITSLRQKASLAGIDPSLLCFACVSGLKPEIASYVLEHPHNSLEDILRHARIAELTRAPSVATPDQLALLTDQMAQLSVKMSRLSTSIVDPPDTRDKQVRFDHNQRSRTPSPGFRHLTQPRDMPMQSTRAGNEPLPPPPQHRPYQQDRVQHHERSFYRPRSNERSADNYQQHLPQRSFPNRSMPYNKERYFARPGETPGCDRCGSLRRHESRPCGLRDKPCFNCRIVGHGFRVCNQQQNPRLSRPNQY